MPHTVKTVYDRAKLEEIFQREFPAARIDAPWDLRYAQISRDYIEQVFAAEFAGHLLAMRGTLVWAVAWDCDKFADLARSLLKIAHGVAQGFSTTTPEGVTCAKIAYLVDGVPGLGHCVNAILTERGIEAWEPQTRKFFTLKPEERASAWLVQF